jgi:hypothetical protein
MTPQALRLSIPARAIVGFTAFRATHHYPHPDFDKPIRLPYDAAIDYLAWKRTL